MKRKAFSFKFCLKVGAQRQTLKVKRKKPNTCSIGINVIYNKLIIKTAKANHLATFICLYHRVFNSECWVFLHSKFWVENEVWDFNIAFNLPSTIYSFFQIKYSYIYFLVSNSNYHSSGDIPLFYAQFCFPQRWF